ncbi:MAG: hypothetical protein K6U78_12150 [Anaerolineae bacterium]|nr:hypothetical protein [Anaerolineae bacterium]
MSHLLDDEGNVYEQGLFGGWHRKQGLFGPEKDVGWFGQPNVERDFFGNPVPESTFFGGQVHSDDGRPLYRPATPSSSSSSSSGGDAAAALLTLILIAGVVFLAGVMLVVLAKVAAALFDAWRDLTRRHPRAMRVVHLAFGMIAVGLGLSLAGFDLAIQVAGAALVPALWAWLWLTRRLPLVFLPINALLAGGALWLIGEWTRPVWLPIWPSLTAGLPAIASNLSLVLAVLPLMLLLLAAGSRRWPTLFAPINCLVIGGAAWFALMRVWTDWQPAWRMLIAPLPLAPHTGWLIALAPLALWLWFNGQQRWPLPFLGLNLLVFGGLLALTAYHLQPAWMGTWRTWTAGLPIAGAPFIVIGVAPFTLWSWNRVSRRWPRAFVVPNLLLTGGILWLILDRTRSFWMSQFRSIWGDAFVGFDVALIVLALPLAIWLWGKGSRRWPRAWSAVRAFALGVVVWGIAESTRQLWEADWRRVFADPPTYAPLIVGLLPPLLWLRAQARRRWPIPVALVTTMAISAGLFWLMGQLFPRAAHPPLAAIAALPWVVWGWGALLHRRPRLGWALTLLVLVASGLALWLAPGLLNALVSNALRWLAEQGVPITFFLTRA